MSEGRSEPQELVELFELLSIECDPATLSGTIFPGEPVAKGRARSLRSGGTYTPKETRRAESNVAIRLRNARKFDSNVAVAVRFYRSTRHRVDLDNLVKLLLDGATKARVWRDDCQVTAIAASLHLDEKNPRTVVAFGEHRSTLSRAPAKK